MDPDLEAACNEMSSVLCHERDLLDGLAYRLEAQRLALVTGDDRRLPRACRELEMARDEACTIDMVRTVRLEALARALRLNQLPNLATVADAVSEPWREMYVCDRRALGELTDEILKLAEHNRSRLETPRPTDLFNAGWGDAQRTDHCLMEIVYEVAMGSLEWVIAPALTEFLA